MSNVEMAHSLLIQHHDMAQNESFSKRSERLALRILRFYRLLRRRTDLPPYLADQLLRAGTSIGANLQEAVSAYSRKELAARQSVALRESRECRFWLFLVGQDQPQTSAEVSELSEECSQFVAMLTTSVRKLKAKRKKKTDNETEDGETIGGEVVGP